METLLEIQYLTYSYNGKENIINNLNLSILKGEILQITGPNGVGKSTLLKILCGLITDEKLKYHATFQGKNIRFNDLRPYISCVTDIPQLFFQLSGKDNITFFKLLWEENDSYQKRVYDMCDMFNIRTFLNKPVDEYSLGTQQKLFLSIILSRNSLLYLMDEPFNSLDIHSRESLVEWIHSKNESSHLIVSHIIEEGMQFSRSIEMKGLNRGNDSQKNIILHDKQ
nr:ABC transporter ATP-binding protein [Fredinandcohnia onubensis]